MIQSSSPVIYSCEIMGNSADNRGGGITLSEESNSLILFNLISNNTVEEMGYGGGGIYCNQSAAPRIVGNVVTGNSSASEGGGIYWSGNPPAGHNAVVCNNVISMNLSSFSGGGVWYSVSSSSEQIPFINNTIVNNTASSKGGGFVHWYAETNSIENTIVWGNYAQEGNQIYDPLGNLNIIHCDIQDGWPGTGNIDADPLFVDIDGGDYHLTWDSPCRNSGVNSATYLSSLDFEGDPRIANQVVDMGADEFSPHLYFFGYMVPFSSAGRNLLFKIWEILFILAA